MRVAFFTHYGAWAYGSNRSLVNLIDGLKAQGVEMLVVSPEEGSLRQALSIRNVPYITTPYAFWMSDQPSLVNSLRNLRRNLLALRPLAKQLAGWRCDAVHTNSSVIPIGAMVSALLNRPHVWHIREFGDLDWGLYHDWGSWVFSQLVGRATARIAVSHAVRAHVLSGKLAQQTVVIYNGIAFAKDFDRLLGLSKQHTHGNGPFTFAIIGYMMPTKGQLEAIQAFAIAVQRRPGRLLVVGDGQSDYVAACKNLAISCGLADRVEFWGYIDDPYKALLEADAVLMCSRNEAMGRVTAEAMAACRPVIGFNHAGTPELVHHGSTGLLYQHGSEELAECMITLMDNQLWSQQLGMNGWETARKRLTIESYAQQVYMVFKSATEPRIGH